MLQEKLTAIPLKERTSPQPNLSHLPYTQKIFVIQLFNEI